ncbi:hypothetical protein D3C87_1728710 [compost metagenome]
MRSDRFPYTFRQFNALTRIHGVHHHRKFFAAHSCHQPVFTDGLLHLAGKLGKNTVPALMTIVIIDAFEIIDIQQHDRQKTRMAMRFFIFQRFIQARP